MAFFIKNDRLLCIEAKHHLQIYVCLCPVWEHLHNKNAYKCNSAFSIARSTVRHDIYTAELHAPTRIYDIVVQYNFDKGNFDDGKSPVYIVMLALITLGTSGCPTSPNFGRVSHSRQIKTR